MARGPRAPAGSNVGAGNVGSIISNLNRNSVGSPPSPGMGGRPGSPGYKRLSSPSGNGRPVSVLGRNAAFSRRTMASDAEDDVVEKK